MITIIDTNIIIDLIGDDSEWKEWSELELSNCIAPIINPLIFTELCYLKSSSREIDTLLLNLQIGYQELPKEALFLAAQAYKTYRQRGGVKTAPLPDFFIGAHAATEDYSILTRDPARYKTYFPTVQLISPSS